LLLSALHLAKLQEAGLVTSSLRFSDDGKSLRHVELQPFDIRLTPEIIADSLDPYSRGRSPGKEQANAGKHVRQPLADHYRPWHTTGCYRCDRVCADRRAPAGPQGPGMNTSAVHAELVRIDQRLTSIEKTLQDIE
jgi:hypothetical protein